MRDATINQRERSARGRPSIRLSLIPATAALAAALLGFACKTPDPAQELEARELETYWALDSSVGQNQYMAPVARLTLRNKTSKRQKSVQATVVFRRKGQEKESWGSAWQQVASVRKPLDPGQEVVVVLESDARYYSTGSPEQMFHHERFKDVRAEVFVRVGSSGWLKFGEADVVHHVGSRSVQAEKQ